MFLHPSFFHNKINIIMSNVSENNVSSSSSSSPSLTHVYMTVSLPSNSGSVLEQPTLNELARFSRRHSRRGQPSRNYQLHIPVRNNGSSVNQQNFRVHTRSVQQTVVSNQHYTNNHTMHFSARRRQVQRVEIDVRGLSASNSENSSPNQSLGASPPPLEHPLSAPSSPTSPAYPQQNNGLMNGMNGFHD